jgi:hypothetical protein
MTDTPVIASACFLTRTLRVESPWSCLACFTELLFFQNHLFAVYLFPSRYVMSASFYLAWVNDCGVEAYTTNAHPLLITINLQFAQVNYSLFRTPPSPTGWSKV